MKSEGSKVSIAKTGATLTKTEQTKIIAAILHNTFLDNQVASINVQLIDFDKRLMHLKLTCIINSKLNNFLIASHLFSAAVWVREIFYVS